MSIVHWTYDYYYFLLCILFYLSKLQHGVKHTNHDHVAQKLQNCLDLEISSFIKESENSCLN